MDAHSVGGHYKFIPREWQDLLSLPDEELGDRLSGENQIMCRAVINHLSEKIESCDGNDTLIPEAVKIVRCLPEQYGNSPAVLKVINHISAHGGFFVEKGWLGSKFGSFLGYSKHDANQQLVDKVRISIERGHGEMALALLESGFPLSNHQKREFLLIACERGETKIAEKLIEQLCKGNAIDFYLWKIPVEAGVVTFDVDFTGGDFEETPLHIACRFGHADIAMMLIQAGADVNALDSDGEPPLFNAFDSGLEQVVAELIDRGADLEIESEYGETLYSIVNEKLLGADQPVAAIDKRLMLLLIERGVEAKDFVQSERFEEIFGDVLAESIEEGKTECALALLSNELAVRPDHLILSCRTSNEKLAFALLEHLKDDDVQPVDEHGNTALHWACRNELGKLALELIKKGASLEAVNEAGDTPIQEAIRSDVKEVIDYLSDQGVDVSAIRWETELKDISRLSSSFSKRISEELGNKSKESEEAKTIFRLSKMLNKFRSQNEKLPPSLQIDERVFISALEKEVGTAQKGNFFTALDAAMQQLRKIERRKQFEALPALLREKVGERFSQDCAKFCLNPSLPENEKFAEGALSIFDHPFYSAPRQEQIQKVLQAKAEQLGLTEKQSVQLFSKLDLPSLKSEVSLEEFYGRADSVLSLCLGLFEAQDIFDTSSQFIKSMIGERKEAGFFSKVANHAVEKWGPILIARCATQDPMIWKESLDKLMTLAGSLNSDDIEFDARVISEVILRLGDDHGFPDDVGKFNKLVSDPAAKALLSKMCVTEASKERYRLENMQLWRDRFEIAGEKVAAIDVFSKEFEPFFQGPVNAKELNVLLDAASYGNGYASATEVAPDVFAKGFVLYYQKAGKLTKVPELEEVIPFCDAMPALKGWEDRVKRECGSAISAEENELFCSTLKETNLLPKTAKEAEIIGKTFSLAMELLKKGGYSQASEAKKQVALGCIALMLKQRKKQEPLDKPSPEALLASFKSGLPTLEGWEKDLLNYNEDYGPLLLDSMRNQGVRGPVNQAELEALLDYPPQIKVLSIRGYSESVAVCALARYIGNQFRNDLPLERPIPEKTLLRFCFEACIERAIANQPRETIEDTVALFTAVKGKELVLNKEGQRRLAFLAKKVSAPDFAEGRAPGHFRVVAKFPQIMSALDLNHVKNINHLPYDESLLGDLFDQQVLHVFKNLSIKELLDAVSVNPDKAIASVAVPALAVLAGDDSPEFKENIQKLIPLLTSRKEFNEKIEEFKKLLAKLEMVNAVELDLEVTTPEVIAGLLSGLVGMKTEEISSQKLGSKQTEEEIALVRQLFRTLGGMIFDADQDSSEGAGTTGKFFLKMALSTVATSQSKLSQVLGSSALQYGVSGAGFAMEKWGNLKSYVTGDDSSKVDPDLMRAMPLLVPIMQKVAVHLLDKIQIDGKQELINYWINLETESTIDQEMQNKGAAAEESKRVKQKKKKELVMMLYQSGEVLLKECQNTLPGLFEGVLQGVKSIPQSALPKRQVEMSLTASEEASEEGVAWEDQAPKEREKAFSNELVRVVAGLYRTAEDDFIINKIIPLLSAEMGRTILQTRTLTSKEISEIKKIVGIGYKLYQEHQYSPQEIAIACCRFCEDRLKQEKPIEAGYTILIEEKERQALLPYIFDAAVELLAEEILSNTSRIDESTRQPEEHLKQKIQLYLNHECIKGCSVPLTKQGRKSLEELIKAFLNPQFSLGKNLLDPLVVERMPLMLQSAKLSSVQEVNQARPEQILKAMIVESDVCMKKINIGTLLEVVKQKPAELMCALSNPLLDVLMEGASFEDEQQAKQMAIKLLTTFNETSFAKSLMTQLEAQLGKFDFKGVSFELSLSLSQLLEGLSQDTKLLKRDLESGEVPTVEAAEEYGLIAPQLLNFARHVSAVQKERRIPVDVRDKELSQSPLMTMLDEAKPVAGIFSSERGVEEDKGAFGQVKKGVISSITETAKFIVTGQSVIKLIVGKIVEAKIEDEVKRLREEGTRGPLTNEQQDQLKFYLILLSDMKPIVEAVSNIAAKALVRHDLSLHTGLVGYMAALSENPQMDVDERILTEHVIVSVEGLLSEVDLYRDLIPGLLGAIASSQKLAS
ncbi:ankyrin repeat domain-containing protein [Estrella lausannensis]|uniref:Uncharacterized protein n=1 Tax=Estrella lausannensis TaxID=483423 RepID=A0A0H5E6Q6_9BACT|nr:ankyrin repeat domain-containing protein [Estrella lausannensis]CRX38965.1 hypothetical protein ELAC_1637 [Estrella lausannensis]